MIKSILVWIRHDFRFHDNPCLFEAVASKAPVILVYIHDEKASCDTAGSVWKKIAIEAFVEKARSYGFGLFLKIGHPVEILLSVAKRFTATDVFWNRRYRQKEIQIDDEVQKILEEEGIRVHSFQGNVLIEPWNLLNKKNQPFKVFNPYWNALQKYQFDSFELPESRPVIPFSEYDDFSFVLKKMIGSVEKQGWAKKIIHGWSISEDGGIALLRKFCMYNLSSYAKSKEIPAADATSKISPYLHFGQLSIRRVWNTIVDASRQNKDPFFVSQVDSFLRQLAWRDFATMILFHFPQTEDVSYRLQYENTAWKQSSRILKAWQYGQTGFPIVDAGMRQLYSSGFMHNRVRMIVGSFLLKHLNHSWKEGKDWFLQTLFDADEANNTFGWQYIAGTGVDAAPPFYSFNPISQGEKFDPDGAYVRQYVPELALVPKEFIHKPFLADASCLAQWNVFLGKNYPSPIVQIEKHPVRQNESHFEM